MMGGSRTESRSLRYASFTVKLREEMRESHSVNSFIPFVQERSATGKLLRSGRDSPEKPSVSPKRAVSVQRHFQAVHTPKLKRTLIKPSTPGVGTYDTENEWIRKTFSVRKAPSFHTPQAVSIPRPARNPSESPHVLSSLTPKFQYTVPRNEEKLKKVDKFAVLRPEIAAKRMEKTNFQSVKLQDDPEVLLASFQYRERRQLKDEKLFAVKRFMRRMVKGKFSWD